MAFEPPRVAPNRWNDVSVVWNRYSRSSTKLEEIRDLDNQGVLDYWLAQEVSNAFFDNDHQLADNYVFGPWSASEILRLMGLMKKQGIGIKGIGAAPEKQPKPIGRNLIVRETED